jgi:NADPH:quinone reductase-like Zn-dependent oxidoreductase
MVVVPDGLEMSNAAGLGSCGQTAVFLCRRAGVKDGDKVLVNGASGGVGAMTVQVARAMWASFVVGVCSGRKQEFVREVGFDEVSLWLGLKEKILTTRASEACGLSSTSTGA